MSKFNIILYSIFAGCLVGGSTLAGIDGDWSEMIWVLCAGIWGLNVFLRELRS